MTNKKNKNKKDVRAAPGRAASNVITTSRRRRPPPQPRRRTVANGALRPSPQLYFAALQRGLLDESYLGSVPATELGNYTIISTSRQMTTAMTALSNGGCNIVLNPAYLFTDNLNIPTNHLETPTAIPTAFLQPDGSSLSHSGAFEFGAAGVFTTTVGTNSYTGDSMCLGAIVDVWVEQVFSSRGGTVGITKVPNDGSLVSSHNNSGNVSYGWVVPANTASPRVTHWVPVRQHMQFIVPPDEHVHHVSTDTTGSILGITAPSATNTLGPSIGYARDTVVPCDTGATAPCGWNYALQLHFPDITSGQLRVSVRSIHASNLREVTGDGTDLQSYSPGLIPNRMPNHSPSANLAFRSEAARMRNNHAQGKGSFSVANSVSTELKTLGTGVIGGAAGGTGAAAAAGVGTYVLDGLEGLGALLL